MPFVHPSFLSATFLAKKSTTTSFRSLTLPLLPKIGRTFNVYNGRKYVPVIYKKEMIGHKLGAFVTTKVIGQRFKNVKKKKKR